MPGKTSQRLKSKTKKKSNLNFRSQKGNVEFLQRGSIEFLILAIVIIGSFVLVGGQYIFDALPKANSTIPALTPTPTGGGGGGEGEVTTPGWEIKVVSTACDSSKKETTVDIQFTGTADGYYSIGLTEAGAFQKTYDFTKPGDAFGFHLPNTGSFNTKPWQIKFYEGGSISGGEFTGGTIRASKKMSATGCL